MNIHFQRVLVLNPVSKWHQQLKEQDRRLLELLVLVTLVRLETLGDPVEEGCVNLHDILCVQALEDR